MWRRAEMCPQSSIPWAERDVLGVVPGFHTSGVDAALYVLLPHVGHIRSAIMIFATQGRYVPGLYSLHGLQIHVAGWEQCGARHL